MPKVDFCSTNHTLGCFAETVVGLIPIVVFIVCGYNSYIETRGRTSYLPYKYTFRHLSKMILSGLIALGCLAFLVIYVLTETQEISIKTSITSGASFLVWTFNSVLLRKEYKSLGYTTNHLRVAWLVMLLCQTVLFIFALSGENTDELDQVLLIYVFNEIFLFAITIIGFSYANDFPKPKKEELYASIMKETPLDLEDHFNNLAAASSGSRSSFRSDSNTFKPFSESIEDRASRSEANARFRNSESEDNGFYNGEEGGHSFYEGATQVKLREDIQSIQSIEVTGWEQIIRQNKETTVYLIEYMIKGQKFGTKRSYSEFEAFRKNVKKSKSDKKIKLPKIPAKKGLHKTQDEAGYAERRDAFDSLLKTIVNEKIGLGHLADFLQSPNILSNYKNKGAKKESKISDAKLPPVLTGERRSEAQKDVKAKIDSGATGNLVPNYAIGEERSQSMSASSSKYYMVDIPEVFTGVDSSTYYKINIFEKSSGTRVNLSKRYNDFKEFHSALKKSIPKSDKQALPELPYKGSIQGFATRDDQRVINFRKIALKSYLNNIVNHPKFQDNAVVKAFIQESNLM